MPRRWIVDASPIILLGKAGHASLLIDLCDALVVPRAVVREVRVKADGARILEQLIAGATVEVADDAKALPAVETWDLGRGESQVLTLARANAASRAVLDDHRARRCAEAVGVPVIGTLGVVLRAKRRGLLAAARPVVMAVRQAGLYVSDELIERALAHLGE